MSIKHQNNFSTNLTSGTTAGDTTSPLNSIPTIDAPFYLAFDATNINSHYEVVQITSKTATNVNHAALTYDHTTAEEVRCVCPAVEMDTWSAALDTTTWVDWTPTFTNFTPGSATIVAKYTQIGKTVHFRVAVTFAADSTMGTGTQISLPVPSVNYDTSQPIGLLHVRDLAPANFEGKLNWASTTTATLAVYIIMGTNVAITGFSSTSPMTWATGDYFNCTGTYEAA